MKVSRFLSISLIALFLLTFSSTSVFAALPDLNTATVDELAKVPGIGKSTAEKIVEYRKKIGKFKTVNDLLNVKGIGQKTIEKLQGVVTLDGKPVVPSSSSSSSSASSSDIKVNINTADIKELMKLPGVGEKTAEKIIDYRKKNGDFKKAEDIKKVKGIGDKTFQKMEKMIVVK